MAPSGVRPRVVQPVAGGAPKINPTEVGIQDTQKAFGSLSPELKNMLGQHPLVQSGKVPPEAMMQWMWMDRAKGEGINDVIPRLSLQGRLGGMGGSASPATRASPGTVLPTRR